MYSYSIDNKEFFGRFPTAKKAATAVFNEDGGVKFVFVGETMDYSSRDFVHGRDILEGIAKHAYKEAGEVSKHWLSTLYRDKAKCAEFEEMIADWIDANDPALFWSARCVQKIMRSDIFDYEPRS